MIGLASCSLYSQGHDVDQRNVKNLGTRKILQKVFAIVLKFCNYLPLQDQRSYMFVAGVPREIRGPGA